MTWLTPLLATSLLPGSPFTNYSSATSLNDDGSVLGMAGFRLADGSILEHANTKEFAAALRRDWLFGRRHDLASLRIGKQGA